ncbi:MAG: hypothetical protein K5985_00185 [Lachnospiraceae bacterium]|nr:hypothetical protein [Lachnospiraceae bacterium]
MTLLMKIREEREEAAIEQMIKTARRYNASDDSIVKDMMSEFQLSKKEALERIREYDLQPV